jgi:hypothetical protein
MVCAPRWVINGLSGEETNAEGTCGTLVTDVKSIQYDGGQNVHVEDPVVDGRIIHLFYLNRI